MNMEESPYKKLLGQILQTFANAINRDFLLAIYEDEDSSFEIRPALSDFSVADREVSAF